MPAKETPVVISYLRFSTTEQLKGDSQRRQLAESEKWAAENGYEIAQRFNDLGVSAFKGANREFGSLARLLKLVEDGTLPKGGTILLVESVDRLSRDNVTNALNLFLSLINNGIEIVTLIDRMRYSKASIDRNPMELMMSIIKMSVANEESVKKSARLSQVWVEKRRQAIKGKDHKTTLPYWLQRHDGKFIINQAKADVVRNIFSLSLKGYGLDAVVKTLNRGKIECIGKQNIWQRSYISKLLHNRAVIGEFQPHTGSNVKGRKRKPIGEPVADYFPRIMEDDNFYAVQAGLKKRKSSQGGPSSKWANLFAGLLVSLDGGSIQVNDKGYGKRYVPTKALKGLAEFVGFPVVAFERAFFARFADMKLWQTKKHDTKRIQTDAIMGRIKEVERKIAAIQQGLISGEASESVVGLLNALDTQKSELLQQLNSTNAHTSTESAGMTFANLIKGDVQDHETRLALRRVIGQLVAKITCAFKRIGQRDYICSAVVELADGREIEWAFRADSIDRMKRDGNGHPIKGGAVGAPQYGITLLDRDGEALGSLIKAFE